MTKEELIERLKNIIIVYGGGYNENDSYEINARGGDSDTSRARDEGREEICDMLSDLITEA